MTTTTTAPDTTTAPMTPPLDCPTTPPDFATALADWSRAYIALQSAEAESLARAEAWEADNPQPALAWVNREEWEAAADAPRDAQGDPRYPVARLSTDPADLDTHGQVSAFDANKLWNRNYPLQVDAMPVASLYSLKTMGQIPAEPPAPVKALLDWQTRHREACDGFTESVFYPASDAERDALDAALRAPAMNAAELHAKALLVDYAARLGDYRHELIHRDQYFLDLARLLPAPDIASLPLAHAQSQTERRGVYELAERQAAERAQREREASAMAEADKVA